VSSFTFIGSGVARSEGLERFPPGADDFSQKNFQTMSFVLEYIVLKVYIWEWAK
jgi:hypothetical protein